MANEKTSIYFDKTNLEREVIIIHISNELLDYLNRFRFFVWLLKLKRNIKQDTILYIIFDYFLDMYSRNEAIALIKNVNFSVPIYEIEQDRLFQNISLNQLFLALNNEPLFYPACDCSFFDKAQPVICGIEKTLLRGTRILLVRNNIWYERCIENDSFNNLWDDLQVCCEKEISKILFQPNDLFGLIMSITDEEMCAVYRLLADEMNTQMVQKIYQEPFIMKKNLAELVVKVVYQNEELSQIARLHFEETISKHNFCDEDFVNILVDSDVKLFDALYQTNCFKTKNELRRLFEQGAIRNLDGIQLTPTTKACYCIKIKVGKHLLFKVVIKDE